MIPLLRVLAAILLLLISNQAFGAGQQIPSTASPTVTSAANGVRDAKALLRVGRFEDALRILRPLVQDGKVDAAVLFHIGLAAMGASQRPGISERLRDALLEEAIVSLHTMLIAQPQLLRVRLELARAFFLKGEDKLATRHFERGLMDLGAATSPVGDPVVVVAGLDAGGPGTPLRETGLQLGAAFGDGPLASLANREIAAFDSLGAPFWYRLGGFSTADSGPSLSERLREFRRVSAAGPAASPADDLRIPLLGAPADAGGAAPALHLTQSGASAEANASHFALAGDGLMASVPVAAGLTASALTTEGMDGRIPATGAALAWRAPGSAFGLRAGWLGERRTLLGTVPEGAFGSLKGSAAFAGVESGIDLGRWRVGANAEMGTIRARAGGGVLEGFSPLLTSAFAVHATRPAPGGGAFRVSLSQPLRVEDGHARLAIPTGRTEAGRVVRERVAVDVAPEGRQIDLALHWHRPAQIGELRLGATLSRHPGHRATATPEAVLLSGWRVAF